MNKNIAVLIFVLGIILVGLSVGLNLAISDENSKRSSDEALINDLIEKYNSFIELLNKGSFEKDIADNSSQLIDLRNRIAEINLRSDNRLGEELKREFGKVIEIYEGDSEIEDKIILQNKVINNLLEKSEFIINES